MFRAVGQGEVALADEIAFMVMAAFWAVGQGMHLSANSINNLIGNLATGGVLDLTSTDIYTLTYFYDEYLSHFLWHVGVLGLAALIIYVGWRQPDSEKTNWWLVIPAGVLYGFTFGIFIDGTPAHRPLAAAVILPCLSGAIKLAQRPILAFFLCVLSLMLLLFIGWGPYQLSRS
jgi:hypothetical protein